MRERVEKVHVRCAGNFQDEAHVGERAAAKLDGVVEVSPREHVIGTESCTVLAVSVVRERAVQRQPRLPLVALRLGPSSLVDVGDALAGLEETGVVLE